jgi:hypothetical protein
MSKLVLEQIIFDYLTNQQTDNSLLCEIIDNEKIKIKDGRFKIRKCVDWLVDDDTYSDHILKLFSVCNFYYYYQKFPMIIGSVYHIIVNDQEYFNFNLSLFDLVRQCFEFNKSRLYNIDHAHIKLYYVIELDKYDPVTNYVTTNNFFGTNLNPSNVEYYCNIATIINKNIFCADADAIHNEISNNKSMCVDLDQQYCYIAEKKYSRLHNKSAKI